MDDERLDELIAAGAPVVPPASPELRDAIHWMIVDAEAEAQRPKRRSRKWRLLVGAGVSVAVFGAGAAANATGLLPLPEWGADVPSARHITLSLPTTHACRVTYTVSPQELTSPQDQASALTAAQKFLASFDISKIDVAAATKRFRAADESTRKQIGTAEAPPVESDDEVIISAVGAELYDQLGKSLRNDGLDPQAVLLASSHRCNTPEG